MKGFARVLYAYVPQNKDELKLEADQLIEVLGEEEQGWWRGKIGNQVGVFPSNFVELTTHASIKSGSNSNNHSASQHQQRIGNMSTNYTNKAPLNNPVNKMDAQHNQIDSNADDDSSTASGERKPKPIRGVGFGNIFADGIKPKLTPVTDTLSGGSDRFANNNHGKPKKPPPPTPIEIIRGDTNTPDTAPVLPPKPSSAVHAISTTIGYHPKNVVREQAKVIFAYVAQNTDELTIKEGDIIYVISKEIEDQGWWKGELNGKVGVFPDNFVELMAAPETSTNSDPLLPRVHKPSRPPPVVISGMSTMNDHSSTPKASAKEHDTMADRSGLSSTPASFLSLNRSKFGSTPANNKADSTSSTNNSTKDNSTSSMENITISDINDIPTQDANITSKQRRENNNHSANESYTILDNNSSPPNKLSHLTTQRARGPSSRRPPSTLALTHRETIGRSIIVDNNLNITNDIKTETPEIIGGSSREKSKVKELIRNQSIRNQLSSSVPTQTSSATREHIDVTNSNDKFSSESVQSSDPTPSAIEQQNIKKSPTTPTDSIPSTPSKHPWLVNLRKTNAEKKRDGAEIEDASPSNNPSSTQSDAKQSPEIGVSSKPPFLRTVSAASAPDVQTPTTTAAITNSVRNLSSRYSGDFSSSSATNVTISGTSHAGTSLQSHPTSVVSSGTTNKDKDDTNGICAHEIAPNILPVTSVSQMNQFTHQSSQISVAKPDSRNHAVPSHDGPTMQQQNQERELRKTLQSQQQQITTNYNEIIELRNEIRRLNGELVKVPQRREMDQLAKQMNELKDALEGQKKAHGTLIKDLINDLAGERKKVASMQIEIDRLQKLTSAV